MNAITYTIDPVVHLKNFQDVSFTLLRKKQDSTVNQNFSSNLMKKAPSIHQEFSRLDVQIQWVVLVILSMKGQLKIPALVDHLFTLPKQAQAE